MLEIVQKKIQKQQQKKEWLKENEQTDISLAGMFLEGQEGRS